jgi:hypothetical protein
VKVQSICNTTGNNALLEPEIRREINRLKKVLRAVPQLEWPYKSRKQPGLKILQPALSLWISQELQQLGWSADTPLLPNSSEGSGRTVDFIKCIPGTAQRIIVQIQFGNSGRMYADFYKFLTAKSEDGLALAVMITLTKPTAKVTDTGIVTFESVAAHMKEGAKAAVRFPLLCIGLTHQDSPEDTIDFSQANFDNSRIFAGAGIKKALGTIVRTLRHDRSALESVGVSVPRARVALRHTPQPNQLK